MTKHPQPSETDLIGQISRSIKAAGIKPRGLVHGVGDDAAVFRGSRGEDFVITQDVQVENRHFDRNWYDGRELGWRLAAVNLSDIAAMGATPRYALFSLVLPASVELKYIERISRGIVAHLARFDAALIGGNVSATDGPLACDLTVIGSCRRDRAWLRRAQAGDAIVMVGLAGEAAAGLELLRAESGPFRGGAARLVRACKRPEPLLDIARLLSGGSSVHGAIDISDGLSTDLLRVCEASRLGCELYVKQLPLSNALAKFCAEREVDAVDWMLAGGEDYALILSVSSRMARRVCARIERSTGRPAAIVGKFTRSTGTNIVHDDGTTSRLHPAGFDHLRSRR